MYRIKLILLIIALCCSSVAFSSENAPVTLRYGLGENDQVAWKSNLDISYSIPNTGSDMVINSETSLTQTVHKVSEDGILSILNIMHFKVTQAKMGENDMIAQMGNDSESFDVFYQTVKSGGSYEISEPLGILTLFRIQKPFISFMGLPKNPVRQGSTWSIIAQSEMANLSMNCSLDGFETYNGYECARISSKIEGTIKIDDNDFAIDKGDSQFFFAIKEGMEIAGTANVDIKMGAPGGEEIVLSVKLQTNLQGRKSIPMAESASIKSVEDLLNEAMKHFHKGEYKKAKSEFDELISKDKESQWHESIEDISSRLSKPLPSPTPENFSQLSQTGNLNDLLALARQTIENGTGYEKRIAQEELLAAYSQYGKIPLVISAFQDAIQEDPKNADSYKILGQAYMVQKDRSKAVEMYEKAVELNKDDADVYTALGGLYHLQKDYQKAISAYRQAINLQPDGIYAYHLLANSYVAIDKLDEAYKLSDEINKVMQDSKYKVDSAYGHAMLGDVYLASKHYEEAIEAYKKAMELDSRSEGYVKGQLIMAYEGAGKKELADELRTAPGSSESNMQGKQAASFTLKNLEGNDVSLSDFAGKAIIVDFWATWCTFCVKEIPDFVELYNQYKDQGFVIIGVSTDNTIDLVKSFVQKYNVNYPIVMADDRIQQAYGGIGSIPTTFIIDRSGIIQRKYVGYRERAVFESDIKEFIGK